MINLSFEDLIKKSQTLYHIPNGLDEVSYYAQKDFEELLYTSPSSVIVSIDGKDIRCILNDVKYGVELEDDKYMLTEYSTIIPLGSCAKWSNENWIVTSKERFTDNGHRSYRLKRCNGVMKFTNKKGEVIAVSAHIYNKLFYTEGIDKYTAIVMPDGLCQVIVQNTPETKDLARNMRIVIGDQVFMITYIDKVTQEGIAQVTLSEVMPDANDDFEDQVADSPYIDGIEGRDAIFLDNTSKYLVDDEVIDWMVVGDCIELITTSSKFALAKGIKEGESELLAVCSNKTYKKNIRINFKQFD